MQKITNLSTKLAIETSKSTLKLNDAMISEELKLLHNKSVVAPINKTSDNVSFVCQRYEVSKQVCCLHDHITMVK